MKMINIILQIRLLKKQKFYKNQTRLLDSSKISGTVSFHSTHTLMKMFRQNCFIPFAVPLCNRKFWKDGKVNQ